MTESYDIIVIGAGIIGLCLARELLQKEPHAKILLLEKEPEVAFHASGRNSGVLHAGFYYTANSLKAKFTKEGNLYWKNFCIENQLAINACGKLVVAYGDKELESLLELERRGKVNGIDISIITEKEAHEIDPLVRVEKQALWSPTTSSVNPLEICHFLKLQLQNKGVKILTGTRYLKKNDRYIETSQGRFEAKFLINAAGLYADHIAKDFGFSKDTTLIPFKGLYLKSHKNNLGLKTHVYPVPNLKNPFLGVHFTISSSGYLKIGPTAIPSLWRENYSGLANFNLKELFEVFFYESHLFLKNSFNFRELAFEEIKKMKKSHLHSLAAKMLHHFDPADFSEWSTPGIRAQLLNTKTLELVQDYLVESDKESIHVLNAVSPAFTCAAPFAKWILENHFKP